MRWSHSTKLNQRRLTADWLAPRESDCSRMNSKVSSDWLPSYVKDTQPVLEIFKMAGYYPDSPRIIFISSESDRTEKDSIIVTFNALSRHLIIIIYWNWVVNRWQWLFCLECWRKPSSGANWQSLRTPHVLVVCLHVGDCDCYIATPCSLINGTDVSKNHVSTISSSQWSRVVCLSSYMTWGPITPPYQVILVTYPIWQKMELIPNCLFR